MTTPTIRRGKTHIDPHIEIADVRTDDRMLWITLTDGLFTRSERVVLISAAALKTVAGQPPGTDHAHRDQRGADQARYRSWRPHPPVA
jgi:hypothetical protein